MWMKFGEESSLDPDFDIRRLHLSRGPLATIAGRNLMLEDLHDRSKKAYCGKCGGYPAFVPRVRVVGGPVGYYLLQLPHLCDKCVRELGFTRHSILIPKEELQTAGEAAKAFLARVEVDPAPTPTTFTGIDDGLQGKRLRGLGW